MLSIHPLILQFLQNKTVAGPMLLPFHYPLPGALEAYQSGFRYQGISGQDLYSTEKGAWQPGWYVLALNGYDDPFFIDLNEEDLGFPVYFSEHDVNKWEPDKIADSLVAFNAVLQHLNELMNDDKACLHFLKTYTDLDTAFWQEVYENISNPYQAERESITIAPDQLQQGKVTLTAIGPHKLKVLHWLKEYFDLSPPEALAMSKQETIIIGAGSLLQFQRTLNQLKSLGATVQFVPDEPATI